ncbi:MAG: tRNA (N6-threonylcarbamoyladenosine(37)-N6)-methyltransferase TrmO [Candidatus Hodarchaeota archaeon]
MLFPLEKIQIKPIGFVERTSSEEDEKDRSLTSKIIIEKALNDALDGITDFSHIYVIFWMHKIESEKTVLHHPRKADGLPLGVFATRAPIHPNPIGLTLVELLRRERNILWVKGLDAYDGTPILDIKPYPDWNHGRWNIITNFKVPNWLAKIVGSSNKSH